MLNSHSTPNSLGEQGITDDVVAFLSSAMVTRDNRLEWLEYVSPILTNAIAYTQL